MKWIPEDNSVRAAIIVGFLIRIIPLLFWLDWPCVRDECTYLRLSRRMIDGQGMTASNGWIWAPGYPFLVAIHELITGYGQGIKTTQSVVSMGIIVMMYRLGTSFFNIRVGRLAAWMYALSPTQIFFAQSLWSECLYGGLLLAAVLYFERVSESESRTTRDTWTVGILVGCCILFRGVATYMLPVFAGALLWNRWRKPKIFQRVLILIAGAFLTVAPYSIYASYKFNTVIISDRTLGQMMWLGNNEFSPVTFDWGNGQLSNRAYKRHTSTGRKPCASKRKPVERDKCQTKSGIAWIQNNPKAFLGRMPLRVAQLLNPHSFVTRHIRWGNWLGLPRWMDEAIVAINVCWSFAVLWLGSAGLIIFGRKPKAILIGGILLYHVAAISILAGLTRYRVPLEPLLMLYAGQMLLSWPAALQQLREERWRVVVLVLTAVWLIPLTLWFLPTGWVWWQRW